MLNDAMCRQFDIEYLILVAYLSLFILKNQLQLYIVRMGMNRKREKDQIDSVKILDFTNALCVCMSLCMCTWRISLPKKFITTFRDYRPDY